MLILIYVDIFLLYRILLPLLHINENVSMILNSPNFKSEIPEGTSLIDYFQTLLEQESTLRNSSKEAELDALQSQINPHFLYNTLESIRGQAVIEGADTIADMSYALSEYFRYNIDRKERLVLLSDEFQNAATYIKIQNYRFNNKFHLRFLTEEADRPTLSRCLLPRLTIQPIIENSLLHGVRNSEREEEFLDILVELTETRLLLRVTDYGIGMDQKQLDAINMDLLDVKASARKSGTGNGIALRNINERIRLAFGPEYGLRVYSTYGAGCTVEAVLPKHLADTRDMEPAGCLGEWGV